jgi:Holliday junction resolvase RusA-like endonuclease
MTEQISSRGRRRPVLPPDPVAHVPGLILGQIDSYTPPVFECFVPGIPRPQGSKSQGKGGRMYESSRYVKAWRETCRVTALQTWKKGERVRGLDVLQPREILTGPLVLGVEFLFPRPAKHYLWTTSHAVRMRQGLRADAPEYVTCTPDLDKLLRAAQDSLKTARVYGDDSLVVGYAGFPVTCKRYANPGEEPGVWLRVWRVA